MIDWLNPSDDVLEARRIGYEEACSVKDGDLEELASEIATLTAERDRLYADIANLKNPEGIGYDRKTGRVVLRCRVCRQDQIGPTREEWLKSGKADVA